MDQQIKEFVKKISEEDLKYLHMRLSQRLGGDIGDSMSLIQNNYPELNKVLSTATTCNEVYNLIDLIDKCIQDIAKQF
jgi:hypothetical protein